jgi:hypothetical protein
VLAESLRDRGTSLAGLDITGLPEQYNVSKASSRFFTGLLGELPKVDPPAQGLVGRLEDEISELYKKFKKEWILPVRRR